MERLEKFEKMLSDIQRDYDNQKEQMAKLKASGKDKTATYKQYFANRLIYTQILSLYNQYGLIDTY